MRKRLLIVLMSACLAFSACGGSKGPVVMDFSIERNEVVDTGDLKLLTGELLSVTQSGTTVVIKAKIRSNLNNKMTIDQNFSSVADLIQNHGFDTCQELQYWAVADMTDGTESKVISFTLDKETISKIKVGTIVWTQLQERAKDLWILPSLKE